MTWRLAPSLSAARSEANVIAPHRSRVSDGTIGDASHQARESDHNPDARGIVHALDLTHDPVGGWDAHYYAERLRVQRDPRIAYIISRDRIAGPGSHAGGWEWHPYQPDNPKRNRHDKHAHLSIWHQVAAEESVVPWWPAGATVPRTPSRILVVVRNYVASLVAPNGGTWHLAADGGIFTDTDGLDGPEAPFYGSVPGIPGGPHLVDQVVKGILSHGKGYKVVVQHTKDDSISYFHFPAK